MSNKVVVSIPDRFMESLRRVCVCVCVWRRVASSPLPPSPSVPYLLATTSLVHIER